MVVGEKQGDRSIVLPGRVPRYKFDSDIENEVRALRKLDNWHGPAALVGDWLIIILMIALCEQFSGWLWWPAYLALALPAIGIRQRALATLLHEAAHGTLAKNKRLNIFLGTWFSGYVIFQSFETYRRSHVRDHHGSFGDVLVDPDLRAHIAAGLYKPQSGARFTWRYLIMPLLGRQTPAIVKELVVARLSGTREEIQRGLGVISYMLALGMMCWALGYGTEFLIYWIIPLLLIFPLVNWYIEMLEHFPLAGNKNIDVQTTRRLIQLRHKHFR
ncbi:fatty acid desaturase [Nocardia sp. NPDC058640]|uniref:fatty acid desaturase n=1 Tax=Nocardia sp. NPDC058640 TaxID=3346571 RepID=UPI00365CDED2